MAYHTDPLSGLRRDVIAKSTKSTLLDMDGLYSIIFYIQVSSFYSGHYSFLTKALNYIPASVSRSPNLDAFRCIRYCGIVKSYLFRKNLENSLMFMPIF